MKRRRRNKGGTRFYMFMSIMCLIMLFTGYSYVYKLSEAKKTGKDIATISFSYNSEEAAKQYNKFFDKVMAYFNVFFEETFNEDDGSSKTPDKKEESKAVYKIIESGEDSEKDLNVYDEENDAEETVEKEVYVANNRSEDFFKVIETPTLSRSSAPREISVDAASVNKNVNILLYHTHGTEAYAGDKASGYRTRDENKNITGIGSRIAANLENYGFDITHLKEYNDYPSYNLSYKNSNNAVKPYLSNTKKNLIIDIHRDGADENSSYEKFLTQVSTIEINNKTAATFALVIGDKNGNLEELKKTAKTVFNTAEEMYPGLCREIIVRPGAYFNQYLSDNALLIEVGSTVNKLEEAQYTADLISEVLCKTIVKINN